MKLKKSELIWLGAVLLFYILYNLPFVPEYLSTKGTIIHALLTLIPLWIAVYVGLFRMFKEFPLKKDKEEN